MVGLPAFFGESFRSSSRKSLSLGEESSQPTLVHNGPAANPNPRLSLMEPVSLTPFAPQQPQVESLRLDEDGSTPLVLGTAPQPVALTAHSIIKSGALKKRSKQMSAAALWQQRFIVLEGPPTHVLVYYYAKAAAAEGEGNQPRGVVPLSVSVSPLPCKLRHISLSLSLSLSLSHTHTHTLTHSLSLSLSSHTHTHTHLHTTSPNYSSPHLLLALHRAPTRLAIAFLSAGGASRAVREGEGWHRFSRARSTSLVRVPCTQPGGSERLDLKDQHGRSGCSNQGWRCERYGGRTCRRGCHSGRHERCLQRYFIPLRRRRGGRRHQRERRRRRDESIVRMQHHLGGRDRQQQQKRAPHFVGGRDTYHELERLGSR